MPGIPWTLIDEVILIADVTIWLAQMSGTFNDAPFKATEIPTRNSRREHVNEVRVSESIERTTAQVTAQILGRRPKSSLPTRF